MSRIHIFGRTLAEGEIDELNTLAIQAGCQKEHLDVVRSIGDPDPKGEDEVLLLLATPATCGDPNLERELSRALNGGRRVIWIWPNHGEPSELPAAVAKYSYSIIPWDANKLRAVAADDDVMCFECATGEPLPKVETARNLCVDPKAKSK